MSNENVPYLMYNPLYTEIQLTLAAFTFPYQKQKNHTCAPQFTTGNIQSQQKM